MHLDPEDSKNEIKCLNLVTNKNNDRKLFNFYVFPDPSQRAQFDQHQSHIQLD